VLAVDLPHVEALLADPFVLRLVSFLSGATGSATQAALNACVQALAEGNLAAALHELETIENELSTVTEADDVVLSEVLRMLLDHAVAQFKLQDGGA
jgi:hypothetical protein